MNSLYKLACKFLIYLNNIEDIIMLNIILYQGFV